MLPQDEFCGMNRVGEFFPGTRTQDDHCWGKSKGYLLNVLLDYGLAVEAYKSAFEPIMTQILDIFRPTAIACSGAARTRSRATSSPSRATPCAFNSCGDITCL
ncbi:hypothetical protein DFH07DRAFT_839199 [Mycena maculata]|uniref:Histone deacetylase domain-containing protein n=1 Tax=Mycena maculata TaxID=230809 RepID=A0AAD7IEU4_9AGAR|nr:hypothetical protein DFH07DRAFT_839199 [Mycena maculata]